MICCCLSDHLKSRTLWERKCPSLQRATGNWIKPTTSLAGAIKTTQKHSQTQPSPSCQMRCQDTRAAQDLVSMKETQEFMSHHSNKPSLYKQPAQICTLITPCPSRAIPKTLIISVLHEGHSNCFIITMAADLSMGEE